MLLGRFSRRKAFGLTCCQTGKFRRPIRWLVKGSRLTSAGRFFPLHESKASHPKILNKCFTAEKTLVLPFSNERQVTMYHSYAVSFLREGTRPSETLAGRGGVLFRGAPQGVPGTIRATGSGSAAPGKTGGCGQPESASHSQRAGTSTSAAGRKRRVLRGCFPPKRCND